MRNRAVLSLAIILILLGSLIPISGDIELDDVKVKSFADSEPQLLVQAGTSTGHVNSSFIEEAVDGWVISGNTRNNLQFGSFNLQATSGQNANNDADLYIAKIGNDGTWQWATMPDATAGLVFLEAMTSDMVGNIYVAGLVWGTVSFGGYNVATANGGGDGFVAKLDPQGNWMWANIFSTDPNSNGSSWMRGLDVDSGTGNVIVSGSQSGSTMFDNILLNNTDTEYVLANLDGFNGAVNWAESAGGIGTDIAYDVGVDMNGNIWQVGVTAGTFSAGGKSHQAVSQQDTVLVKWSTSATGAQVTNVKGLASNSGALSIPDDLAVTDSGEAVVVGAFIGTIDAGNQKTVTAQGTNGDGFVAKISANTNTEWITSVGSSANLDWATSVRENNDGDWVIGGFHSGTSSFGNNYITSYGGQDGFVAQISDAGSWDWVETIGGQYDDLFGDVAVNMTNNYSATGSFQDVITKGTQSVTSSGGWDIYVWALDPMNNADKDNDGVNDLTDNCPNTNNPLQYDSDLDGDGDECDYDDDNDGITDNSGDDCPRGGAWNWTSDSNTDFDNDGCKDSSEDLDDDNDGVEDSDDDCLTSYSPPRDWWVSDSSNDIDGDGCRDADEDLDDDGDGYDDAADDCNKIAGTSTLGAYEGCPDADGDGWADIEDNCPNSFGNSTIGGTIGCPDTDGDGWANSDDDLPDDPTQWKDTDGDGYGDNTQGTTPDACINTPGTSVLDRYGCPDPDNDGYSSEDDSWTVEDGADVFPTDETQWSDWDEDGFGDNYGNLSWSDRNENWPGEYYQYARDQDACPTLSGNSWQDDILGCPDGDGDGWANFMDAFPADPDEYLDSDGDGVADGNDDCPVVEGYSTNDVLGCPDFDMDGWGDPSIGTDWNPMDATQWANLDGDQYGDNPVGLDADDCVEEAGYSFEGGVLGCLDTDNDGWADIIDKFPGEASQWNDTDGDGFGDNPTGKDADLCPEIVGVAKENGCEAVVEDSAGGSFLAYGGIAVGVLLVIIVAGLLIMRRMDTEGGDKDWNSGVTMPDMNSQPAMPNMAAMPVNTGLYAQQVQPVQPQHTSPALSSLPGNMEVAPQQVVSPEPTVVQQWTDANGNTWRSMSDGSTLWWNGADWQRT